MAIGDSQTFGQGISFEETYIARAGEKLNVPVANLGVSGYGTVGAVLKLETLFALNPEVVVLGHYYDHPIRMLSRCYPGFTFRCMSIPHVELEDGNAVLRRPRDNRQTIYLAFLFSMPGSNGRIGRKFEHGRIAARCDM